MLTDPDTSYQIMANLEQLASDLNTKVQISAFKYCPEGMSRVSTIAGGQAAGTNLPMHDFH
jgi:hypothetical protein